MQMNSSTKVNSDPNVVPLCDILLVLLIIFMVLVPAAQIGIDISLPEGTRGPSPKTPIVLTIEENGLITVNKEKFTNLSFLEKRLTDIYHTRVDKTIYVKAHHTIPYKRLISTMDVVKGAGVDTISVVPTPKKNSPGQPITIPVSRSN